jgi:Protein of unknown function (DUF3102)
MSTIGGNRLTEIKEADKLARRSAEQMAAAAIHAGHKLIEAKGLVGHDNWLPWLKEHCQLSEHTAQRYMRIATSGIKSDTVADFGLAVAATFGDVEPPVAGELLRWYREDGKRIRDAFCWPSQEHPGYYHLYLFDGTIDGSEAHVEVTDRPVTPRGIPLHLAHWWVTGTVERHRGTQQIQVLEEMRADVAARHA